MWVLNSIFIAIFAFTYLIMGAIVAAIFDDGNTLSVVLMVLLWPLVVVLLIIAAIIVTVTEIFKKIIHRRK